MAPTLVLELTVTLVLAGINARSELPGTPEGAQLDAVCQLPSVPVKVLSVAKPFKEIRENRTMIQNKIFFMVERIIKDSIVNYLLRLRR